MVYFRNQRMVYYKEVYEHSLLYWLEYKLYVITLLDAKKLFNAV